MNTLKWKRVYDPASPADGDRILVDQLWPRGVSKEDAALDGWAKSITPGTEIRKAYHQGTLDFDQFSDKYQGELETGEALPEFADDLKKRLSERDVTLVFAGKTPSMTHLPTLKRELEKAGVESAPLPAD